MPITNCPYDKNAFLKRYETEKSNLQPWDFYFRSLGDGKFLLCSKDFHDCTDRMFKHKLDIDHILPPGFEEVEDSVLQYTGSQEGESELRMDGFIFHNFIGQETKGHVRG